MVLTAKDDKRGSETLENIKGSSVRRAWFRWFSETLFIKIGPTF